MASRISRRSLLAAAAASAAAQEPLERFPRKIRVALVGLDAHIGEILNPLRRLPDVELVAVSDPKPEALEAFGRRRGTEQVRRYRDHARMLDAERPDVAGVCTPNGERAAAVLECLRRKCHVVAEKPLALTFTDLRRIREALRAAGVRLTMMLPMRFSSPYLAVKQICDSGEIGEVCQIASQKSYKAGRRPEWMRRRESYGGTIPWIGIHMIDLMRWASGREFEQAFSWTAHIGFPEIGDMENVTGTLFRLDNRGIAVLRMDYLRPETAPTHGDDRLRLAGTKGIVEYQRATGVTVVSASSKPRKVEPLPPSRSLFVDFLASVYLGRPHALPLEDVFRVNEITIAAQQAADEGRVVNCSPA